MSTFTNTSPTSGGELPEGATEVGGVVLDLIGLNGIRVVAQLAASDLFVGFYNSGTPSSYNGNPGTIGILSGFSPQLVNALGGGLQEAAVRITLFDGDTAPGDFDTNDNDLLVNGVNFGDFTAVQTQITSADGTQVFQNGQGFLNDALSTGFFYVNDATALQSLYTSLSAGTVTFQVEDVDPYDNFFDFTRGVDGGLVDVGSPPNVAPLSIDDAYVLSQNAVLTVGAAAGVLANDSDFEGSPLTASLVQGPANGTLTFNPDGSFTYTPNAGFTGTDLFSYRANDGSLDGAETFVGLTIRSAGPISGVPTKGDDNLTGTTGDDVINAQDGNDTVNGGAGNDFIYGGGGRDKLLGGGGDDRITGGQGNDTISGGGGDDRMYGGGGNDVINGGNGFDRVLYRGAITNYDISLDSQGRLKIVDLVADRDGSDTVQNVDEFNFGGQLFTYADLLLL